MEDTQKTASRLRRVMRLLLFVAAGAVWLVELIYLISARENLALPISWPIFLAGGLSIQLFFVPALILALPSDPQSPKRILVSLWLIFAAAFWIFAPFYESLALYEEGRQGILALMTNYIWEVPVIGLLLITPLYFHFTRIIRALTLLKPPDYARREQIRRQLIYFPMRAALFTIGFVMVAIAIGLAIARVTIQPPLPEMIKNSLDIMTVALLAGILIFFAQGNLIRPWLEHHPRAPKQ